ncbi:hypothetical protein EJB05_34710, partial [Eragrostis curvula]
MSSLIFLPFHIGIICPLPSQLRQPATHQTPPAARLHSPSRSPAPLHTKCAQDPCRGALLSKLIEGQGLDKVLKDSTFTGKDCSVWILVCDSDCFGKIFHQELKLINVHITRLAIERCSISSNLPAIEYRSSDGEKDIMRHVFRWDKAPYEFVFQNGLEARRQDNGAPDE